MDKAHADARQVPAPAVPRGTRDRVWHRTLCVSMRRGALAPRRASVFRSGRAGALVAMVMALALRVCGYHTAGGYWDAREEEMIVRRRHDQRKQGFQIERNATIGLALDEYMELAQWRKQVQGYFELQALLTYRVLAASQLDMGVYGGVAEIGVHHGMSFVPLCLLNADAGAERSLAVAIDVFEHQERNLDGSGAGDREIFMGNVARWCGLDNISPHILKVSHDCRLGGLRAYHACTHAYILTCLHTR